MCARLESNQSRQLKRLELNRFATSTLEQDVEFESTPEVWRTPMQPSTPILRVDRLGIEPSQKPCKGSSPALEHCNPFAVYIRLELISLA